MVQAIYTIYLHQQAQQYLKQQQLFAVVPLQIRRVVASVYFWHRCCSISADSAVCNLCRNACSLSELANTAAGH